MYADFIEDKLAEQSEYIRLLKEGLKNFKPEWMEDNFRQKIKYDGYQNINALFDNVRKGYSDEEKLFIYNSVYTQAGFRESMMLLADFIDGMTLTISDPNKGPGSGNTEVSYRPAMEFEKSGDKYINDDLSLSDGDTFYIYGKPYAVWSSEYNTVVPYLSVNKDGKRTDNLGHWVSRTSENKISDGWTYIFFNHSPYINSIANVNERIALKVGDEFCDILEDKQHVGYLKIDPTDHTGVDGYTIDYQNDSYPYKFIKDESVSTYFGYDIYVLAIKDPPAAFTNLQVAKLISLDQNLIAFYQYSPHGIENYSLDDNYFSSGADNNAILNKNGKYTFAFSPYEIKSSGQSYPQNTQTYTYKITISFDSEVFIDQSLAQSQIQTMMRELLLYKGEPGVSYPKLTFEVTLVNKKTDSINLTPKIFRFILVKENNNA